MDVVCHLAEGDGALRRVTRKKRYSNHAEAYTEVPALHIPFPLSFHPFISFVSWPPPEPPLYCEREEPSFRHEARYYCAGGRIPEPLRPLPGRSAAKKQKNAKRTESPLKAGSRKPGAAPIRARAAPRGCSDPVAVSCIHRKSPNDADLSATWPGT